MNPSAGTPHALGVARAFGSLRPLFYQLHTQFFGKHSGPERVLSKGKVGGRTERKLSLSIPDPERPQFPGLFEEFGPMTLFIFVVFL